MFGNIPPTPGSGSITLPGSLESKSNSIYKLNIIYHFCSPPFKIHDIGVEAKDLCITGAALICFALCWELILNILLSQISFNLSYMNAVWNLCRSFQ